jgi:hypothetical protein
MIGLTLLGAACACVLILVLTVAVGIAVTVFDTNDRHFAVIDAITSVIILVGAGGLIIVVAAMVCVSVGI